MSKKTIIVTGGNSGIGFLLSKKLCASGHEVILACRSNEKGNESVQSIKQQQSDANVSFMKLDLANLSSVRCFAKEFISLSKPLDVLVNNAGLYLGPEKERQFTEDKFEMTMGTNHLGHYLLTNLLLDCLKTRAGEMGEARVVVITSTLHDREAMSRRGRGEPLAELDIDDMMLAKEGVYANNLAYKNSKLCNVLFAYHLSAMLAGTGVTVNAVCPGFIPETNLSQHNSMFRRFMFKNVIGPILKYKGIAISLEDGVNNVRILVDSEEMKGLTGKFYQHGKESESSSETHNKELQNAVWEKSAQYCHMEGYEPLDP